MNLDDYLFPDGHPDSWFVAHLCSTGSSRDGTRQHRWHAVKLTHAVLAKNVTLYSEKAARDIADLYTRENVES